MIVGFWNRNKLGGIGMKNQNICQRSFCGSGLNRPEKISDYLNYCAQQNETIEEGTEEYAGDSNGLK